MKPPKPRRNPPVRDFSQPRATKKAKNGQSQQRNEPGNMTTQSDNHNRSNANSNAIQANSSRSTSSIPQHQHSSVGDGPWYYPVSEGQSGIPSEGLLPIQPNKSGHQGNLVTSAPSVGPIHQTLHQVTIPGPNAEMCTPANSGSGTRQGAYQPPAFHGTTSSSDAHVNHRKTPENQINPPVQNFGTFNQTLLNSQGVVNDSNSFEPCLHVDVNQEKMQVHLNPFQHTFPLNLKIRPGMANL